MKQAKIHRIITIRHKGWDIVWQCSGDVGEDLTVWQTKDGNSVKENWGFNTIEEAIDWMQERIEYLYPDAEYYPEKYIIHFMDVFSFATCTKEAMLTPKQVGYTEKHIRNKVVVHTQHDKKQGITWNWMPTRIYRADSAEARAEQTLAGTNTSIFK